MDRLSDDPGPGKLIGELKPETHHESKNFDERSWNVVIGLRAYFSQFPEPEPEAFIQLNPGYNLCARLGWVSRWMECKSCEARKGHRSFFFIRVDFPGPS